MDKPEPAAHLHEEYLNLNVDDPEDLALVGCGGQILTLLKSSTAQKNCFLVATLDDFLGAIYALIFAKHNTPPFENRSGPIEVPVVLKRAENVAAGSIRRSGKWLAGFHFNSALFRIAAAYHRGLKVVAGKEASKDDSKGDLLRLVEPAFPDWKHSALDHVHKEVNKLKHDGTALTFARDVTWAQAKGSVTELIELFALWISAQETHPT